MSAGLLLAIVFAILQLTHTIDWSWWWVLSPIFFEIGVELILLIVSSVCGVTLWKRVKRR